MEKIFTFDGIIFKFELFYQLSDLNKLYPEILWVEISGIPHAPNLKDSSMEFLGRVFENFGGTYETMSKEKYEEFRDFADVVFLEFFNVEYREYPKF